MNSPSCNFVQVNGVTLCYFEWNSNAKPTVLLIHATGFHARCWDASIAALTERFRIIGVEMRGHGRSEKPKSYEWASLAEDLRSFVKLLDLKHIIGVGHSMGGHSLTEACATDSGRYQGLLLVDPVIFESRHYLVDETDQAPFKTVDLHPISRRRDEWNSPGEMVDNFSKRHPFSLWTKKCLEDYCKYGLIADESGVFRLACPPRVEASIYLGSRGKDPIESCRQITVPTIVMRAQSRDPKSQRLDFSKSPTRPDLYRLFPKGEDRYLPNLSHFIPMQRPDLIAQEIQRLNQF